MVVGKKLLNNMVGVLVLVIMISTEQSCYKEFSQEGVRSDTAVNPNPPDPNQPPRFSIPSCPTCVPGNLLGLGKWSFKIDTTYYCGNFTSAVIAPERQVFTFFGPSACSPDTGLIMTVYLEPGDALRTNKQNISTEKVVFQYYERGQPDILSNKPVPGFRFIIDQYTHASNLATGSFAGVVYTQSGKLITIKEGRYEFNFQ